LEAAGTWSDAILEQPDPWKAWFPLARNWRVMGVTYFLWVGFLVYGLWASGRLGAPWWWASALSAPLTHIGAFAFLAPLPWILPRRLASPWKFVLGFIFSLVTCETAAVLLPLLDGWLLARGGVHFSLGKVINLYTSLVGPGMMIVGGLIAARAHSEERREASEAEAQIAKNRLLQSQIHPHVLFNALNGLAELVHKDAKAAERAIRHLSDLLRNLLQASEHVRLPLREERKVVADYLALEAFRLGPRLRVTWEWDLALDAFEVPPLLLQPLVENAIKHGIAPSVPGGELVLRARLEEGAVLLEVWNSGMPFRETVEGRGIGVKNLRSRLSLHFGSDASLTISPSGQGTLACIRLEATQVECVHETAENPGRR
jgi:hypothetical protein